MINRITIIEFGVNNIDFLPVKALKVLQNAEVAIFRGTIDRRLEEYLPRNLKKIYLHENDNCLHLLKGNAVLISLNEVYDIPEVKFLHAKKITFDIIPSVKPFLAYPALHKIPVTRRGVNLGFVVVKELVEYQQINNYINICIETKASLLFTKNISSLSVIVNLLKIKSMSQSPIGILNPNHERGEWIISTVDKIEEAICFKNLSESSIIFIGEVLKQYPNLSIDEVEEVILNKI